MFRVSYGDAGLTRRPETDGAVVESGGDVPSSLVSAIRPLNVLYCISTIDHTTTDVMKQRTR